ncbi:VOC family protein [Kribbella shirazensis]|uniref:Catechol 2,3-dioxygenase-like lactoylglutathione lyase family enzyme n=1 Tax=Kribbella shirazensis TaxID=1105143 RepID=A0A7X6A5Y2_9ACTN|nr:VOC family protein [Kribbella shirazensis]NIK62388.1 catechol 2,3-dioxygenase-like lactoylglutathione lyase family enzyme [Kribbella shirazensis]
MSNPALKTGHVALNVTDLGRSIDFYEALFDFDVLARAEDERAWALLGTEGVLSVALWEQSDGSFATGLPGLHHLSFEVPDIEAVRAAETTLERLGVEFFYDGVVAHGEGATSGGVFFHDPDGVRLEIYATTGVDGDSAPVKGAPTCGFF